MTEVSPGKRGKGAAMSRAKGKAKAKAAPQVGALDGEDYLSDLEWMDPAVGEDLADTAQALTMLRRHLSPPLETVQAAVERDIYAETIEATGVTP